MRLQFDMTKERVKELDALIEHLGLKTRVNLLNEALTLYEWAIREREAGRIIASVDEEKDTYKEIEMPGFPVGLKGIKLPEGYKEVIDGLLKNSAIGFVTTPQENTRKPVIIVHDNNGNPYILDKDGITKPEEAPKLTASG